jgi:hypothetical protein
MESLMGRPSQIRDDDIDTELPCDTPGFAAPAALSAHLSLCKIMGEATSQVFRIRRRRKEDIDDVLSHLLQWRENLPVSLSIHEDEQISYSRSVLLLHLSYNQVFLCNHSLILVNHPHRSNCDSRVYHHPRRLNIPSRSHTPSFGSISLFNPQY